MHQNKPADVPLVGDGQAVMQQFNKSGAKAASGSTPRARPGVRRWRNKAEGERRRRSPRRSTTTRRRAATTGCSRTSASGCRRTSCAVQRRRDDDGYRRDPDAARKPALIHERRLLRHDGRSASASSSRLRRASRPAGRPCVGRLGDRLLRHGDGDALPLQLGQAKIVILNNGGIGPGMPDIPCRPDAQHAAEHADLRRSLRPK